MSHWQKIFGLKCENRDVFFAFYSKAKGVIHKLTKVNSVAATDNVFLKAYFAKVIEAPELQTKVQGFLKDTFKSYIEVLEDIHADYRAQAMEEDIRGVPGGKTNSMITALARRGEFKETRSSNE